MDNQKAMVVLDSALPFAFFSETFAKPNDFRLAGIEYFNDTMGIRSNLASDSKGLRVSEFFELLFQDSDQLDQLFSALELFGRVDDYSIPLNNSSLLDSLQINCGIRRLQHGQYFLQGFISPAKKPMPQSKTQAFNESAISAEALPLAGQIGKESTFDAILGTSAACARLKDEITQIARLNTSVLLSGAQGTGKKMVARAIHEKSGRNNGPFILQSCRDISEDCLDGELFGLPANENTNESPGLLRSARGGILVLEEIQDLSLYLQAKLLRVLQDGEIRIPGTARYEKVDVRIIMLSTEDLEPLMHENRFRDDLYYEICVFSIRMPTLAERQEDIIELAEQFLSELNLEKGGSVVTGIAPLAKILLKDHHWQGQIRELRQVIKRAALLCESDMIEAADLILLDQRAVLEEVCPEETSTSQETQEIGEEKTPTLSKNHIIDTLAKNQGNKTLTAKELNMSRATLWRKLKSFAIATPADPH
jgi:DNA-binding NtrC family response regulator